MKDCREALFHWPGWRQLGYAIGLGLAVTIWFAAAYGGADWLTEHRSYRVRFDLPIDLSMPLVPAMTVFYLSLNPLLWCAPFILRGRSEYESLAITMAAATAVAATVFIMLPGQDVFAAPQESQLGGWAGLYRFACWLALSQNYLPSLHVAFTTIAMMVYTTRATRRAKLVLWGWGLAIIASTMLIHAHYVADVASGMLLGWLSVVGIYRPLIAKSAAILAPQTPPADNPVRQT